MHDLKKLFLVRLRAIYDGEHQLVNALSQMEFCAQTYKLKTALFVHLAQTKRHVTRLEEVFKEISESQNRALQKPREKQLARGAGIAYFLRLIGVLRQERLWRESVN